MTSKDKQGRPLSSSRKIYRFTMKKTSAINRRSPCFLAETCRRLFKVTNHPLSLVYLVGVVAVIFAVSGLTWRTIAGAPAKNQCDQVFLNFRGEELRYNFVSHLTEAFGRNEINFFIDTNEQRGKDLQDLFLRIEQSNIALAIFSPRYTESKWCMDELVKMKELADKEELIVIPIFNKVKAEDVGKLTIDNKFGRNFWRLTETSNTNQTNKWKEALKFISGKYLGLSLGDESSEAQFIKNIVEAVKEVIEAKRRKSFWKLTCGGV